MIILDRFNVSETYVIPIVNGVGQINGRKVYTNKRGKKTENGWYKVELGNTYKIIKKASLVEISQTLKDKKGYRAFPLGQEAVPINFNNFTRLGLGETVRVYFLNARPFDIVDIIRWEDGNFYYRGSSVRANRTIIRQVKYAFENDKPINEIQGVTPELAYTYLVLSLQKQSIREAIELEKFKLSELERAKRVADFQSTFSGRLKLVVENAGGKLVRWAKQGENFLITWKTGGQTIKSLIRDNMRVVSAGFCLSNHDVEHTLNSLPSLLRMYQEQDSVVITRT